MFYGHIGGVDALARALLAAADIVEKGDIASFKVERYEGWKQPLGQMMVSDEATLSSIADHAADKSINADHRSGRQEYLESLINRSIK